MRLHFLQIGLSAFTLLYLLADPVLAQDATADYGMRLDDCNLTLQVSNDLQPVEVQPDSFLGFYKSSHIFVAIVCRPNPLRTFEPPQQTDESAKLTHLQIHQQNSNELIQFHGLGYRRQNHPVRKSVSENLYFASRDHRYYLTAYPDPKILKAKNNNDTLPDTKAALTATINNLHIDHGTVAAITEKEYNQRLITMIALIFTGIMAAGLLVWYYTKRSIPHK